MNSLSLQGVSPAVFGNCQYQNNICNAPKDSRLKPRRPAKNVNIVRPTAKIIDITTRNAIDSIKNMHIPNETFKKVPKQPLLVGCI